MKLETLPDGRSVFGAKLLIPKYRDMKRQGEYAEMRFQAAAAEHALDVSKPYGNSLPYDFVIDNGKRLLPIQVKSVLARYEHAYYVGLHSKPKLTWRRVPQSRSSKTCVCGASGNHAFCRRYNIGTRQVRNHKRKGYNESEIDFIVALVIPEDTWYVIPISAARNRLTLCVFPHNPNSRGMFEPYREAWHLLQ